MKKIRKNIKGFSFIEVMLAVFIVTAGLIVSIQLVTQSLSQTIDSRNQIIASELAQEGVELVRNVRDTNWMTSGSTSFNYFPPGNSSNCRIDYSGSSSFVCSQSYQLFLNSGYYSHNSSGSATRFYRKIVIAYDSNGWPNTAYAKVTSIVTWNSGVTWPADTTNYTDCTASKKCAYTQVTLMRWGGT